MADSNWLTPKATVRPCARGGLGAFAVAPIRRGEVVAAFGGEVVTRDELERFDDDRRSRSLQIDDDLYLAGAEPPEPAERVNHCCDPSCLLSGTNVLVARRDLAVGDELTYDYATSDGSDYDEFECTCGAPVCRGKVTGHDWTLPDVQARYRGALSPYLQRRLDALRHDPPPRRPFSIA